MITWHTRFWFGKTAQDLDDRTLAYQIDQAWEVMKALVGFESDIDENHPVLMMWEGYEFALGMYGMEMGHQLSSIRHIADNRFFDFYQVLQDLKKEAKAAGDVLSYVPPPWMEDADVCRSHRSNLARRQPEIYGSMWPRTPANMPYIWPILDDEVAEGYVLMVAKEERDLLKSGERSLPKSIKARISNL